MKLGT